MKRIAFALFAVLLVVALVACGAGKPTAEEILRRAADTMAATQTLQFILEREGEPIQLEAMMNAAILSAQGAYQAPDSVYATVKVNAQGIVAEAEVLWLPGGIFYKLPPLIPNYKPIALEGAFDAAAIFDAEVGLPHILIGLANPKLVGEEDVEGTMTYHVSAQAEGSDLANLVGGAVPPGPTAVDIWVAKDTYEVVRVVLTEEAGNKWLLDFYGFGEPVEIPAPQ